MWKNGQNWAKLLHIPNIHTVNTDLRHIISREKETRENLFQF